MDKPRYDRSRLVRLDELPPTLTVPEAANLVGLGLSAAYEAVRQGRIPAIRVSERRIVVPTAPLLKLLGIGTGSISGICVLDVDGEEGMTNLINADLEPPETLTSRTGGGGWHFIYRLPEGGIRNSAGKIAEKVDIRGEGGYIVVPPSNHISGGIYEWEL